MNSYVVFYQVDFGGGLDGTKPYRIEGIKADNVDEAYKTADAHLKENVADKVTAYRIVGIVIDLLP